MWCCCLDSLVTRRVPQIQQVITVLAAFVSVCMLLSRKPYKAASDNKVGQWIGLCRARHWVHEMNSGVPKGNNPFNVMRRLRVR